MSAAEGAYRCSECRTWRHLVAWAAALAEGPLNANGEMAEYTWVEDCYLHEDSIHCTKHMGAAIEMFHDGRWCRYWCCGRCHGRGRIGEMGHEYECPAGLRIKPGWGGVIHSGWLRPEQIPQAAGMVAS